MQKKEKIRGKAAGAVGGGALGPGAAPVTLGLFLLPGGRPGRCLARATDDDPAAARVVLFLFLLPRGRPQPHDTAGEPRFRQQPSAAAEEECGQGKRLENPRWREKMMRQRKNLIRVFTRPRRCFICKHILPGPHDKQSP
jgi:hypothetical protein